MAVKNLPSILKLGVCQGSGGKYINKTSRFPRNRIEKGVAINGEAGKSLTVNKQGVGKAGGLEKIAYFVSCIL